ncbi:hypothetical protein [Paraburkholderia tropica]|uniref:hypothetical protein n=1 Tax=Paraburkholderia tropica TaxID=92647 RepID=UPI0031D4B968
MSKTIQAVTTFSASDHYTAKTGRFTEGRQGWAYSGTLFRNGQKIATFDEYGDGAMMRVDWINTAEEAALRDWYHRIKPGKHPYYEGGFAIETVVNRSLDEADLRRQINKRVFVVVPGDVRNGGKSAMLTTKVLPKDHVLPAASRVQERQPDDVVLNLLPFDAAFALYMTLNVA